jgi:hypothetical protein
VAVRLVLELVEEWVLQSKLESTQVWELARVSVLVLAEVAEPL